MRHQYYVQKTHCVVCGNFVPPDRLRFKSITCSDACKKARKRAMYVQLESRNCMFCRKPATRGEQALWKRFRAEAAKQPEVFFAAEFKEWKPSELEPKFTYEIGMTMLEEKLAKKVSIPSAEARGEKDGTGVSSRSEMGSSEDSEGPAVQDPDSERNALPDSI